ESPLGGASLPRDGVLGHEWAAEVSLRVAAEGVSRVEYWAEDSVLLGEATAAPWALVARFRGEGPRSVVARGLDADGVELVRDEVSFTIGPPSAPDCHSMLDALGLDWAPADAARGITDPVRVQPVIAGVGFRYYYDDAPRALFMDCALAPRLYELAQLVAAYGYDEIVHIGIYNYRCIGGGDPDVDGCRASQHAFAHAIDIAGIGMADGSAYDSLETDWVITPGPTCPGAPASDADRELHELACAMHEDGIFQIVLTPNYNDAHRGHFHVDMTEGSMFIEDSVHGVDSPFAISDY
ncbi:MAG: extensin family protein, partial [Deltaproteobacteria bacterium]|nr:extensin family protein [Deltaproteobacteria bacterium]